MNFPVEQFDLVDAMSARRAGLERVELNNKEFLLQARAIAVGIALKQVEITSDDVRKVCDEQGIYPRSYHAWGALFKGKDWKCTGKRKRSSLVQGHGNLILIWTLSSHATPKPQNRLPQEPEWGTPKDITTQCVMYCKDPEFQEFMQASDEEQCAEFVRRDLHMASRAELTVKPLKRQLWRQKVYAFRFWQRYKDSPELTTGCAT